MCINHGTFEPACVRNSGSVAPVYVSSNIRLSCLHIYMYECIWLIKFKLVNWRNACPFVTVQGIDLNMKPAVEDFASPCDTLSIVCSTSTRDYQIYLIESRVPNSRGVHMLHWRVLAKLMIHNPSRPQYQQFF